MADRPKLAEDLIFGAERIGAELGVDGRQAFTLITKKIIPAFKLGGRWAGRRSAIHQRIAEIEAAALAEPCEPPRRLTKTL